MDVYAQSRRPRCLKATQVSPGVDLRQQATVEQLVVQPGLDVGGKSEVVKRRRAEGNPSFRRRLRF